MHLAGFLLDFIAMMDMKVLSRKEFAGRQPALCEPGGKIWIAVAAISIGMLVGCHKDVDIPPIEVKLVEAYGMTLDEDASPQQVVYVLLRSLREDFESAQAKDRDRQKQAFETTFSVAAFSEIEARLTKAFSSQEGMNKSNGLGAHRDQKIYDVIYHWTPIIGHYIRSIDTDPDKAIAKMRVRTSVDVANAHVYYDVSHDPQEADPAKKQLATLDVELVKEKASAGSKMYWRVARVAFQGSLAKRRVAPTSAPATTGISAN